MRAVRRFYQLFIASHSKDEDMARRELILNYLIVFSFCLSVAATLIIISDLIGLRNYRGENPYFALIPPTFFLGLFALNRSRYRIWAASSFVALFALFGTYCVYRWGILIQMGLLVYVLTIIMAGVLINTLASLIATLMLGSALIYFAYAQAHGIIIANLYWQNSQGTVSDAIVFFGTFVVIFVVTFLSNREIKHSLTRARNSEKALRQQRDQLEEMVEERTNQLKEVQLEKMTQLYRSAELGRLTAGLFHDLVNPLSSIDLNLQEMNRQKHSKLIAQSQASLRHLEGFIQAIKRQISQQDDIRTFRIAEEINQVIRILNRKAIDNYVAIETSISPELQMTGNANKFFQVIINLVSNALDAYKDKSTRGRSRRVIIAASQTARSLTISIQDYAGGIAPEHQKKIFEPFFTTKSPDQGTGIGLSISQEIVEKDFGGSLALASKVGKGSNFIVTIPLNPDKNIKT